ncbi:Lysine exporter protein (LYSE/YGGA) [Desulfosarcina cetonica]|uniref:LysE family translocator n=1 Tax=Desulfosarcina cetonica TaxID=90730 RepID=UPI0006D0C176|nr:LysE family translocator [Desulfosarcina cetonica]VTR69287.1 Lysine exporter protein (LYSE/YGGA) [Desulfosarcina cetonica]
MPSTEFLLTSLVVVLMPGTGVIYTVSTGLFRGWRASTAAALGCTAGIVPHLLASILGLSAILHVSALAFQVVKMAGVAYLLYLAWSMWRDTGVLRLDARGTRSGAGRIITRGFLINILNPKLSIFFLAFLPLFVSPDAGGPLPQMFLLSGIFMVMTLVIFVLYGICADMVRTYVVNSPKTLHRLQRSFALLFAALGIKLALAEQ